VNIAKTLVVGETVQAENATLSGAYINGTVQIGVPRRLGRPIFVENRGRLVVYGPTSIFGTLTKPSGSFKIDHPLDPVNRYLSHSFVESPDMLNIYNGNVTTDVDGEAIVELPSYFQALNRSFRYQLTVIGQFAQAIVGQPIERNRFVIKTDRPQVTVSWQVTGVRQDAYAKAHPIIVEEDKPQHERGFYLYPEVYDRPDSQDVVRTEPSGQPATSEFEPQREFEPSLDRRQHVGL
jgi:hypothetical protein